MFIPRDSVTLMTDLRILSLQGQHRASWQVLRINDGCVLNLIKTFILPLLWLKEHGRKDTWKNIRARIWGRELWNAIFLLVVTWPLKIVISQCHLHWACIRLSLSSVNHGTRRCSWVHTLSCLTAGWSIIVFTYTHTSEPH